jgi:hypothetical protein
LVLSITAQPYWYWGLWDPTRAYFNFMQRLNLTYLGRTYDLCDLIGFNYTTASVRTSPRSSRSRPGEVATTAYSVG